jgi:hypothetical protein
MKNSGLSRGTPHYGLVATLFVVMSILAARSSLAQTVTLDDNRPPQAAGLSAPAAATRPLTLHISFRLRNRDALSKLLKDLQDPASPDYHRWLTPAQFNARFGRTPAEVKAVSQWLSKHGLRVVESSNGGITSAATVAQAEETFATSLAASADGARYSTTVAPQIPARFADVIGSIDGLDNLRHWTRVSTRPPSQEAVLKQASNSVGESPVVLSSRSASKAALSGPAEDSSPAASQQAFAPRDIWTFYDETPPINGAIDGSRGDCLATIQDSDYLDASVSTFDQSFNLPNAILGRVFADTSSPGINGDETEALVDIEWAHSVAPGVGIAIYIGNSQFQKIDPLTDSLLRAVSDNSCGVVSFTYAFCGAAPSFYTTTLGNAFIQAAAQGQSVFAAAGDWGSAGLVSQGNICVTASTKNVSELSANPYVTSVGGTQFVPTYDANGNDVGNVPESAWNNGAGATGGGQSTLFAKPSYQNVVTPGDGVRDLPDVAMAASNATPGFFWVTDRSGVPEQTCCIGGTSISTPMWAAVSKLIAEIAGPPYRLGAMNPRIYQLGGLGNASSSGLRDVVMGNNSFNGVAGFTAAPGYDLASGWGSPDVQTFESAYLFATIPPTPSPAPTPSPNITFVGAGPLTDSTTALTTVTVALPSGVEAGDTMIAQIVVYDGTASDVPTRPSGWSSIRNDAVNGGNEATSWLYYKVAGANEPASYSWNISSNFAVAVMGAWRGTTLVPIENSSGATAAGNSPITVSAPSLTPNLNHELEVYFYASQAPTAPTLTLSGALNQRFNLSSLKEGFALAFADLPAPFANNASPTYPGTASTANTAGTAGTAGSAVITAQAMLLVPGATPTPTSTATASATASATSTPTPVPTPTRTATVTVTATPTASATATATTTPTTTATRTATATPTPAPTGARIAAPASVNVGSVAIGEPIAKNFSIKNSGKGNLIGSVEVLIDPPSRASVFTVNPPSFNIAPGQSVPETVTFEPDVPNDSAVAIISSNDATQPFFGIVLSGTGLTGNLSVPSTFTMTAPAGTTIQPSLTIKNNGKGSLSGDWASVTTSNYSVAPGSFALEAGQTTTIPITFIPTVKGNAPSAALAISVIAPSTGSTIVTLKGVGK